MVTVIPAIFNIPLETPNSGQTFYAIFSPEVKHPSCKGDVATGLQEYKLHQLRIYASSQYFGTAIINTMIKASTFESN